MKRVLVLQKILAATLIAMTLFSGCVRQLLPETIPPDNHRPITEPSAQPQLPEKEEETEPSNPSEWQEELETAEPLPYEEYFSKERPLIAKTSGVPHPVSGIDFNTLHVSLYDILPDREVVYTSDNRRIYLTSDRGTQSTLVYAGSAENVSNLRCDGIVFFFLEGDMVRRMYLPDGSIDDMCMVKNEYNPDGWYNPETNHMIWWTEFAPEMEQPAADAMGISLDEFMALANKSFGVRREFNFVTGETVSIGESYIIEKYYNDEGN